MFSKSSVKKKGNGYSGICPRCDHKSQFKTVNEFRVHVLEREDNGLEDFYTMALLSCSCDGYFLLETDFERRPHGSGNRVAPDTAGQDVPYWIPKHLQQDFKEMKIAQKYKLNKSAIAVGGIIVETIVNEKISKKEIGLELGKKIEKLIESGSLDLDQISSGTIARLSRNKVLHPKTSDVELSVKEVGSIISEIEFFIEREYKFRSSKALPAPKN